MSKQKWNFIIKGLGKHKKLQKHKVFHKVLHSEKKYIDLSMYKLRKTIYEKIVKTKDDLTPDVQRHKILEVRYNSRSRSWFEYSLQKNVWSGSWLLRSVILKNLLSGVLILAMWPEWMHKHLRKNIFSWKKSFMYFMILLEVNVLDWFWSRRRF